MVECGICLEEYEEADLELHRQMCEVRLMFRCSLCGGDYMNKEGLWNHLDLHEIADEIKELHCQEIKAKHKLHQCVLCNDQRAYSEMSYWKHVHDVHDGNLQNIQIVQDQKQVQNIDLKMEITVEETTKSTRDDQGLSSVNLSSDVLDSRSNEQSSAYLSEDEIMYSQVIENESQTVSVAPLNCSSKRQVVSEKISQSLDENLSNQPYFCNICGITMHKYSQFKYHRAIKHNVGRHQCPNCSRKFPFKIRLEEHVSRCARLKYSCELCGQKFNLRSRVEDHKKIVHHGSRPLRDANIEGADCTEAKKQDSVKKIDAAEEMTSCIVCRISFGSTDELKKHKLNCPTHSKEHDDSQFCTENISLLHGASEAQADSMIVAQGEIIDVKLEIEVEETLLQEEDFQVPNQNPERSSATTLTGADVIRPANLIDPGYVPIKSCFFEDAKLFVKNFEFGFGLRLERISKKGSMRYYRCLRFKVRVNPQCERKVLMFTPNVNEKSTVCVKGEHSCINAPPNNMAVSAQIDFGYAPVKTCSIEDAKSFVKNFEFGFCQRSEKIGKKARMEYYRCSRVKQTARPQCERKVLISTPYTNEESTVCAKGKHSCMNAPPGNLTGVPIGFGYAPVKTCSLEDAKSFVKNFEFGFAILVENCYEKGNFRYYRCSRIKQRVRPQCKRKVLIFTPYINEESTVCAKGEHSCLNAPPENLICVSAKPFVGHH